MKYNKNTEEYRERSDTELVGSRSEHGRSWNVDRRFHLRTGIASAVQRLRGKHRIEKEALEEITRIMRRAFLDADFNVRQTKELVERLERRQPALEKVRMVVFNAELATIRF